MSVSKRITFLREIGWSETGAAAAEDGETDKNRRYGSYVQPLVFETYGRLGRVSARTLRNLGDAASMLGLCHTSQTTNPLVNRATNKFTTNLNPDIP